MPSPKERERELTGRALEKLSELSPQEAWQIVVNWIMDVHRQEQIREDIIRSYRLRLQENETKIESIRAKLKSLQETLVARDMQGKMDI